MRELITDAVTGKTIEQDVYVPGVLTVEQAQALDLQMLSETEKVNRNNLLSACDWTILSDSPLTESEKNLWKIYRQNLRNITTQEGFPIKIQWPIPPS
jgi:hypothetical protein